ncbi:CAF1 family ribonuclease-domain-containing protein [Sordaria sp. MPI-SDFR-AT-0083]|nr:CAF1 family ribonuclease-domain-containing protein [Sordaria sp. MPI-SDFR-AT-0083]
MEIDNVNFWGHLPTILDAIADAEFISLSLIGIPDPIAKRNRSKEELYRELVEHSKTYHVSKIGLTCFQYEEDKKEYSARSFNFAITPWFRSENFQAELIAKTVSRTYSFSHDILKQLRTHGWDHNEAWERGVPYLTRYEAQTVEERFLQPWESKTPLNVNKLDVESKKFRNWAYDQITSWLKTEDKTLDLATPSGKRFTSLQVGLVCQLVHSRFDECRATPKDDHRVMHIKKLGRPELTKERLASRRTALTRQSGFLYVVEALLGGQFADDIEPELCLLYVSGMAHDLREQLISKFRKRLKAAEDRNRAKRPILLVHSQLDMLCHFYSTFLGPLPKTLDEFTKRIHQIYPRIVDTRVLYSPDTFLPLNRDHLTELFSAAKEEGGPHVTQVQGLKYKDKMDEEHGPYGWYSNLAFLKVAAKKLQKEPWLCRTRPQKTHGTMRMKAKKPSKLFFTLNPFVPDSIVSRRSSICSSIASGMTMTGSMVDTPPSVIGDGSDEEEEEEKQEAPEIDRLPPWEAVFWEKFGNKLILDDGEVLPLAASIPPRKTRVLRNL